MCLIAAKLCVKINTTRNTVAALVLGGPQSKEAVVLLRALGSDGFLEYI